MKNGLGSHKIKASNLLFLIPYSLFLGRSAIGNTTFSAYISIYGNNLTFLLIIGAICVAAKILFFDKYSVKVMVPLIIVLCVFLLYFRNSTYIDIIILLLLFLASNNVDLDTVVKCHFRVYLFIMLLAAVCALTGIIDNYVVYSGARGNRYSLGNTYPTDFAAGVLYLFLDYAYLNRDRWKKRYSIVIFLIAIVVYRVTNANAGFVLSIAICLIMMLYGENRFNKVIASRAFCRLTAFLFPLLAVVSIYIQNAYSSIGSSLLMKVDLLLNNRIAYGNMAIRDYGLSLFGMKIDMIGGGWRTDTSKAYFYVDSGYLQLALTYGVIALLFISFGFFMICLRKSLSQDINRSVLTAIFFIIAISALVEPRFYNILYNAFLIDIGIELFKYKSGNKSKTARSYKVGYNNKII